MQLFVNIKMDNAAFEDDTWGETARILRKLAMALEINPGSIVWSDTAALFDANGNRCGTAVVR